MSNQNDETLGACFTRARAAVSLIDAEVLTCKALDVERPTLYAFAERTISASAAAHLSDWLDRRVNGEPVAYITGEREFWSLPLRVEPFALIPRPETETLVAAAVEHIDQSDRVLDLGCGTGAVGIAIGCSAGAVISAVDVDRRCVDLTLANAAQSNVAVEAYESSWFDNVRGRFDTIVSNPPYIADTDVHLSQGDVRFEPKLALVSGSDGLDAIRHIVAGAPAHLNAGGRLLLEHGFDQSQAVSTILAQRGFTAIETVQDLSGHPRVTLGTLHRVPSHST